MSDGNERRQAPRLASADHHGIVSALVRPGQDALVVDVSSRGALIETAYRLLPGTSIELKLATSEQQVAIRCRVLRCSVVRLRAAAIWYRGALGFDRQLPWFVDDTSGYPLPGTDTRPIGGCRAPHSLL